MSLDWNTEIEMLISTYADLGSAESTGVYLGQWREGKNIDVWG